MKTNTVPDEIYLKHENEWQALRQIADSKLDLRTIETRLGYAFPVKDGSRPDAGKVLPAG
ncbi:hypothetical protein [Rhizobium sp. 18055]|uniref:hypothetical protein n=1 Tax=Rhizobium sp. 18055 TaxID=2681403 RepID=UPI001357A187|nr:hypothetical protein [Rhizobium sp. 18055]